VTLFLQQDPDAAFQNLLHIKKYFNCNKIEAALVASCEHNNFISTYTLKVCSRHMFQLLPSNHLRVSHLLLQALVDLGSCSYTVIIASHF